MFKNKFKLKKILKLFVCLLLLFSIFSLSVFAKSTYTNVSDTFLLNNATLNLYKSSNGAFSDVTGTMNSSAPENDLYYSFTSSESWGTNQRYRVVMSFELTGAVSLSSNLKYEGSFRIIGNSKRYQITPSTSTVYFRNTDDSITYCELSLSGTSDLLVKFSSQDNKTPASLHIYMDFNNIVDTVAYSTVYDLSIMYLDFNVLSESDVIISNQDKNTQAIIDNQNSIWERLFGWNPKSNLDGSSASDYYNKSNNLDSSTADGKAEANSIFGSFSNLLSDKGSIGKGLMAVSMIFTEFFDVGWIKSLIQFSLAIGVFAFVIGTGASVFKSTHEKFSSNKNNSHNEGD